MAPGLPARIEPKAVRALLAGAVDASMRALGFARARTTHLGWFREADAERYECVFFPLGKYGWDARTGGSFDVQLQVGDAIHPFGRPARHAWFSAVATTQDLAEAWRRNDVVARSLPEPYFQSPAWDSLDLATRTAAIDWSRYATRVRCSPYAPGEHVEFLYYTTADVEAWGAYFAERIGPASQRYFRPADEGAIASRVPRA